MTLIEFIGFVITLAAMIFIVAKRKWEDNRRRQNPELFAEQEKRKKLALKQMMKSLNLEMEEEREYEEEEDEEEDEGSMAGYPSSIQTRRNTPPPLIQLNKKNNPRKVASNYQFNSALDSRYEQDKRYEKVPTSTREEIVSESFRNQETSSFETYKECRQSRVSKVLSNLPTAKNMLIIKEVFGPPKSMRINPWDE